MEATRTATPATGAGKVTPVVAERAGIQTQLHKLSLELLEMARQAEEFKMRRGEILEQRRMLRDSLTKLKK